MRMKWVGAAALLVSAAAWGQTAKPDLCAPPPGGAAPALPAKLMDGMGQVDFRITTSSPETQRFFNQGVAQMHSFWFTEAERSFLQAAQLDPEAPMPHWGIAMVAAGDYRPRHQLQAGPRPKRRATRQPLRGGELRANEAVAKALELSAKPGKATPLERLYIESIAARRNRDAADADGDYIRVLRQIAQQYPGEVEAKSILSLHLMRGFDLPDHKPREHSMEAVALLKELRDSHPDHPGVHHYIIHGWEGSDFAEDAWESCRRYPELVPNIPHALHMPGHIWAQTGKWEEAVQSFTAAAQSEVAYMKADALYGSGHHGHNVNFLSAAYGFKSEYENALKAAKDLLEIEENPREKAALDNHRTAYRQGWFSMMRTLVQFEKWQEILAGELLPVYDKPREQAWRHWAAGVAHASRGDSKLAREAAREMDRAIATLRKKSNGEVPEVLEIARMELAGQIEVAANKIERGLRMLSAAARKERSYRYSEPPHYPRPVLEAMGALAMKHGRTSEARAAFEEALKQYPASSRSLQGLAQLGVEHPQHLRAGRESSR